MSGVIDDNGVQWEHCNDCGKFVRLTNLGYLKPSEAYPHGKDLCVRCVDAGIQGRQYLFHNIVPASSWKVTK